MHAFRSFDDLWLDVLVIMINIIELNYFSLLSILYFEE
jgi:hypothetical protein